VFCVPLATTELLHYYEHLRNRDHFSLELGDDVMLTELPEGLKDEVLYSVSLPRLSLGEKVHCFDSFHFFPTDAPEADARRILEGNVAQPVGGRAPCAVIATRLAL
jgi:hypothetical protein